MTLTTLRISGAPAIIKEKEVNNTIPFLEREFTIQGMPINIKNFLYSEDPEEQVIEDIINLGVGESLRIDGFLGRKIKRIS